MDEHERIKQIIANKQKRRAIKLSLNHPNGSALYRHLNDCKECDSEWRMRGLCEDAGDRVFMKKLDRFMKSKEFRAMENRVAEILREIAKRAKG